jgi:hypothetical protein
METPSRTIKVSQTMGSKAHLPILYVAPRRTMTTAGQYALLLSVLAVTVVYCHSEFDFVESYFIFCFLDGGNDNNNYNNGWQNWNGYNITWNNTGYNGWQNWPGHNKTWVKNNTNNGWPNWPGLNKTQWNNRKKFKV